MNLIKSFLLIFLGILLIASVSAATQTYAEYSDRSNSATITQGQSISFNAGFYASSPMTVNLKLYTSNYQLVHTFENNKAINTITNPTSFYKYKFSSTYSVTPSKYVTTGSYFIILSSTDASGSQSEYTLDLRVNPSVPTNHAPIITSSPITSVDENTAYAYNVDATDADGDFLTYSLTQNPLGFSINSATGLITGTAPSVTPGTTFIITVQVSDGITSTSQTYTLAVNDISSNNPPLVISTPVTSVDENTAYAYNVDATDADGDFLTYSLTQNPLGFSINSATGLITGTAPSVNSNTNYNIEISVSDGISTFIQAYVLTVDNVGSHSGGGNGGIREIDSSQPTTIKKSIGYVPTTTTKKTTSTNASTLIIFYVIILFVTLGIFFVTFLLIQNLRNREVETGKKSKFSETYY